MPDNQHKRLKKKSTTKRTHKLKTQPKSFIEQGHPARASPDTSIAASRSQETNGSHWINQSHWSPDTVWLLLPASECEIRLRDPNLWKKRRSSRVIAHDVFGEPIPASYLRCTNSDTGASAVLLPPYPCAPPGNDYLIVTFSLSRLTHGVNYGPVNVTQASQCISKLHRWLEEIGIHNANLHHAQLCRFAANYNLVLDQPVSYYLGMIAQARLPRMQRRLYRKYGKWETVLFHNGQRSVQCYDKILEMLSRGEDVSHLPHHVMRIEYTAKNAVQCRKFFGCDDITFDDFLNRFSEIPARLQAALAALQPDHDWLAKLQKDDSTPDAGVLALVQKEIKNTVSRWRKNKKARSLTSAELFKKWSQGNGKGGEKALKLALSKHPDIEGNAPDLLRRIEKILRHDQLNAGRAAHAAFIEDYLAFFAQIAAPDFLTVPVAELQNVDSKQTKLSRGRSTLPSRQRKRIPFAYWLGRFSASELSDEQRPRFCSNVNTSQKIYRLARRRDRRRWRFEKVASRGAPLQRWRSCLLPSPASYGTCEVLK